MLGVGLTARGSLRGTLRFLPLSPLDRGWTSGAACQLHGGVVIAEKLTLFACLGHVHGLSASLCLCLSTGLDPCRGRGADLDPDHACALSRGSTIGSCHVSVPGAHRLASCHFVVDPCHGRSLCRDPDRGACRLDPYLFGGARGPSRSADRCACRRASSSLMGQRVRQRRRTSPSPCCLAQETRAGTCWVWW